MNACPYGVTAVLLAPRSPGLVHGGDRAGGVGLDDATVAEEGGDRAREVVHGGHQLAGGAWLQKPAPSIQPFPARDRPSEDAGQLGRRRSKRAMSSWPKNDRVNLRMINRPARAPLTSRSRGSSLEISTNRVESLPVQAGMCFRSMVWSSSPLIDSKHSTIAALSGRLDSRASGKTAIGLPIKVARPNGRASVDNVGLTTVFDPASDFSTRAIVPRPDRLGPTIIKIFCCRVSGVNK